MKNAEHVLMHGTEIDTCLIKSYMMWLDHVSCMQRRVLDKQIPILMKQLEISFSSSPANDTTDAALWTTRYPYPWEGMVVSLVVSGMPLGLEQI